MGLIPPLLESASLLIALAFFLLGAVGASFVGVITERLHTGQSIIQGRSRCNACSRLLGPLDLVPVISWLVYRGRCRTCQACVPGRYALTEFLTGSLFVLSYYRFGLAPILGLFLGIVLVTLAIVLYDLAHTVVPSGSAGLLLMLCTLYALLVSPNEHVLGLTLLSSGLIGLGFFLLHAGSGGRAMGLGDTPISMALALLVGFPYSISGLACSFWIGAIVGVAILVFRRGGPRMGIEVPFVPFLAIGFLLVFFTQWNIFLL